VERHWLINLLELLVPLLWLGCTACVDLDGQDRRAWLQETLIEDNLALLARDPATTGGKFLKMGSSPYNLFRGTVGQFVRDSAQRGPGYLPTRFGSVEGSRVLLVGDPHLENLGTFRAASGELLVDFNDFDASGYGPWILDVRRLALSVWLTAALLPEDGVDAVSPGELAASVARGYADEVSAETDGSPPLRVRAGEHGAILDDLFERAEANGDADTALSDYTRVVGGRRVMVFGELEAGPVEGVDGDVVRAPPVEEQRLVEAHLAQVGATLIASIPQDQLAVKGVSRRLGAGVSSYPLWRYYVLVEGPTQAPDDDWLLEVKETSDPPRRPGLAVHPGRQFASNGARVVSSQRALQERPDADPLLGCLDLGRLSFRVRERTSYQRGLAVDRIVERVGDGRWSVADLQELATIAGRLLARAHLNAPTLHGGDALLIVAADLGGDRDGLAEETTRFVEVYGPQLLTDHQLLNALLADEGPTLGYRP